MEVNSLGLKSSRLLDVVTFVDLFKILWNLFFHMQRIRMKNINFGVCSGSFESLCLVWLINSVTRLNIRFIAVLTKVVGILLMY